MSANRTRLTVTALEARDCPATLSGLVQALAADTVANAHQLVHDVAVVEYYRPTVARNYLVRDIVALNNAANASDVEAVFADTAQLLNDLKAEARLINAYHLNQNSPLAYQAINNDLGRLVADRVVELRIEIAVEQAANQARMNMVQQQFQIPSISSSQASIQASHQKLAQLNNLESQQASYFNSAWVDSFSSGTG